MYAILPSAGQVSVHEALMLVDDRGDADEIARELIRRGRRVVVREVNSAQRR